MDFRPGDKFGDRYQLISKLGEGGMGEVWKEICALTGSKGADIKVLSRTKRRWPVRSPRAEGANTAADASGKSRRLS